VAIKNARPDYISTGRASVAVTSVAFVGLGPSSFVRGKYRLIDSVADPARSGFFVTGPLGSALNKESQMSLFTKTQHETLIANCQAQIVRMDNQQPDIDFKPVVKLFTPDAQCTWLLTELGLDDIAFGLCDLGLGCPELGFVCMRELREARGPLGLPIERDSTSTRTKPSPPMPTRLVHTDAPSPNGHYAAGLRAGGL
jgi:Protein of unknown function (DUF2958)